MQTKQDPREPVLLKALKIMLHAKLCLSVIKKRKDSAGSGDTASINKGGGYLGARTRQSPTAQTIQKLMWVRGVVCRSTRIQSLTVVACVVLQCMPFFMSADVCLMECSFSLCIKFLILW